MNNQQTQLHNPQRGSHNKAGQQRDYRERERLAFCNLLAALNEVEPTNARSRNDILERAAACLRRLGAEQFHLRKQLGMFPDNIAGADIPQPEAQMVLFDDDVGLLQLYLGQSGHLGEQIEDSTAPFYAGEDQMRGYIETFGTGAEV